MMPACLQYIEKADQVGADISVRVLNRIAYAGLGCQIDNDVEGIPAEQA